MSNQILRVPLLLRGLASRCYSTSSSSTNDYENRNVLNLKERGLLVSLFPDKPDNFHSLMTNTQSVYCGFDPTADSLHVGNLLALIALIHCQRRGHNPIALIGSATTLIGDPSGKTTDRDILKIDQIAHNSQKIQSNIEKIFANHEKLIWAKRKNTVKLPQLKILNNITWYESMNIVKFMSVYGRHLRMGNLMSRKHIESRLKSREGINYTEFSYQVFQAFDWLHLFENHHCSIQLGGNDQTGNIKTGWELISRVKQDQEKKVFGLTLPIITTDSGEKFGKSAGNAIWLESSKVSPYSFYQFFVNTSDKMVETYLKLFTFMPLNEIDDLMREHRLKPDKFRAQKALASELTLLVHGEEGLESALKCTEAFFGGDRASLSKLSAQEIETLFQSASKTSLVMEPGMTVLELAMKAQCFKDMNVAERIIKEGGLYINFARATDPSAALVFGQQILMNNITVIRVGKKKYFLVKWLA